MGKDQLFRFADFIVICWENQEYAEASKVIRASLLPFEPA